MRPIQMVDLQAQYQRLKPEIAPVMDEVLETATFINGPAVKKFSDALSDYMDSARVIACANGTDALQIALMALDLQPGDEVITPSFTYIATTEVVALLKLKPVFAEVDKRTFCIDPARIEELITPRTKAIVPVHLYGQSADMEAIMRIADRHGLYVIEDNAQAIGSRVTFSDGAKKRAGTIGHIGTTSFFPAKNLGCYGDGGAIFTGDETLAAKMAMIANHGQSARYYHDVVGCNSRLDSLQAAVLSVKLKHLDEFAAARQQVAQYYNEAFSKIPQIITPATASFSDHVFHQYTLVLDGLDRDALKSHLESKQIPAMIYYPVPGHRQKMFAHFGLEQANLPVTDWLTERVISLPVHTEMTQEQLKYITDAVLEFASR